MNNRADTRTKRFSRVDDQRHYRMPPTWVPRQTQENRRDQSEIGRAVHVSGRNRELVNRIVSLLNEAREMVVLSSFLLADQAVEDAILAAAKRKVRVYILLASEARLDIEETDGEFERDMRDQHRKMLDRLGGYALFRSAPHFHAKFVLADPGDDGTGLLLTANLTKEALERNEELAIELTCEEVKEAFVIARWALWEYAEHELIDPDDRFRSVKPIGCVEHPASLPHVLATTSESKQLQTEALRIIKGASRTLVVASFGWDANHSIVKSLCARTREGLSVTVLARVRENQMPALISLAESGVRVLGFKWLHAKALCADSETALVMSANLQLDGLDRGFEMGVLSNGERAGEVHDRLNEWSKVARWELQRSPKLGDIDGEVRVWHKNKLTDMTIEAKHRVDLGTVKVKSADKMDDAVPPDPPSTNGLPVPAHKIVYEWSVRAPVLKKKQSER